MLLQLCQGARFQARAAHGTHAQLQMALSVERAVQWGAGLITEPVQVGLLRMAWARMGLEGGLPSSMMGGLLVGHARWHFGQQRCHTVRPCCAHSSPHGSHRTRNPHWSLQLARLEQLEAQAASVAAAELKAQLETDSLHMRAEVGRVQSMPLGTP